MVGEADSISKYRFLLFVSKSLSFTHFLLVISVQQWSAWLSNAQQCSNIFSIAESALFRKISFA